MEIFQFNLRMVIYWRYALLNLMNIIGHTTILAFSTERNFYIVSKGFDQPEFQQFESRQNVNQNKVNHPGHQSASESSITDTRQYLEMPQSHKTIPKAHENNKIDYSKLPVNQSLTRDDKQAPFIGLSLIPNTENNEAVDQALPNENPSKEEMDCLDNGSVYYNQTCEKLFTKNVCKEGHWLLLDLKSALKTPPKIIPKCKQQKCADGYIYWDATQRCYLVGAETDKALCFPGNTLEKDYYFGYGICGCVRDPIVHGLFDNGTCFPLFTRGPCQEKHLFVEHSGITECVQNPCRNSSLVPWDDGDRRCYELYTQGPCNTNEKFLVSTQTLRPICTKEVNLVSIINPPTTCVVTSSNKCQPEVKVKQGKEYMKKIVLSALKISG